MNCIYRKLTFVLFLCLGIPPLSHTQSSGAQIPHRIINAQEINTAGYDRFKLVLHYLMPDLFPNTEQGWVKTLREISFYIDDNRSEQEDLDGINPRRVKRIEIWEKRWEPAPMAFPDLAYSRFVVRIETNGSLPVNR
ncbi:MAG: hypothetical protein NTU47_12610 [Ignavibacteriales bacterium]|nr:hypothetical protein [Ignavibacteriales bacterium]